MMRLAAEVSQRCRLVGLVIIALGQDPGDEGKSVYVKGKSLLRPGFDPKDSVRAIAHIGEALADAEGRDAPGLVVDA